MLSYDMQLKKKKVRAQRKALGVAKVGVLHDVYGLAYTVVMQVMQHLTSEP